MKKIIAVILTVLMLASAFAALPSVSADMTSSFAKGTNQELLDMLNKLDPQQFTDYSRLGLTEAQFAEIKDETLRTVASSGAVTDYDALKAIAGWVSTNIKYDYNLEGGSQDAYNVFTKRLGICQGYSNVTTAMCAAAGIPCIMVNGDSSAGGHAWSMAYADGRWIFLDTTWGNSWFDVSIEQFGSEHRPYYCSDIKIREGDFVYTYFNGVAPCQYVGEGTDWVIPSSALNMAVTSVSSDLFNSYDCNVETLVIPETVKYMDFSSLIFCAKLKKIDVAENNQSFASVDGVIFDKSVSNILLYPSGKTETSFAIPDTVKSLSESVFEKNTNLTDVLIPASVTSIGKAPFADNSKITVYADEGTYGWEFAQSNGIACKPVSEFEGGQTSEPVNKEALEALVNELSGLENIYTVNSYRQFAEVLGRAADVLKDSSADQDTVDKMFEELKSAYENLRYNMGDVDHDGKVTTNDVTGIQLSVTNFMTENFDRKLADVNEDNVLNILDATICQMVTANLAFISDDGKIIL